MSSKAKGRRSLPMQRTDNRELAPGYEERHPQYYAYELNDPHFPPMAIRYSHNAWWMEKYKLEKLIDAYKMHCTDLEACYFAGITKAQLRYFKDLHPEFKEIRELCKQELGFYARQNVARDIKSGKYSLRSWEYLQKKHKDELGDSVDVTSGGKPLKAPSNAVVFMDFSKPDQREPEVIDAEKIHDVNPDTDDGESK